MRERNTAQPFFGSLAGALPLRRRGEEQSDKPGLSGSWFQRRIGFVGAANTASGCNSEAAESE